MLCAVAGIDTEEVQAAKYQYKIKRATDPRSGGCNTWLYAFAPMHTAFDERVCAHTATWPSDMVVRLSPTTALCLYRPCNAYYGDNQGCRCDEWFDDNTLRGKPRTLPVKFVCGRGVVCIEVKVSSNTLVCVIRTLLAATRPRLLFATFSLQSAHTHTLRAHTLY